MNEDYVAGFMAKAAELGVDPEALLSKVAVGPIAAIAAGGAAGGAAAKAYQWNQNRKSKKTQNRLPVQDYKAMRNMRQAMQSPRGTQQAQPGVQ